MESKFFLLMQPPTVTAQQHRAIGRGKGKKTACFDTPELKDAKQKFLAYLMQHKPEKPMEGPVRLTTKWCFPMTSTSKHGQYKATRPDTDNLIKLFKDCMTKTGFWHDDAQVASEITEKFYSDVPGIYVQVMELPAEEGGAWNA